jgi:ssDNA thymidine ADP-ribosyltransferase, DarT
MTVTEFIQATGIPHLYHFTDEENLPLIREHGLLPYAELLRRGIVPPKPGGNEWSRDADSIKGVDRYVHLCLKDQHPMEYVARQNGHIGTTRFLQVSVEVLSFDGAMGCSDVANKSGVVIRPLEAALDGMDLQILFGGRVDFTNKALRDQYNEAKKSEVLIPVPIPTDMIRNLS